MCLEQPDHTDGFSDLSDDRFDDQNQHDDGHQHRDHIDQQPKGLIL